MVNLIKALFESWDVPIVDPNFVAQTVKNAYQYVTVIEGKTYTSFPVSWLPEEAIEFCHSRDEKLFDFKNNEKIFTLLKAEIFQNYASNLYVLDSGFYEPLEKFEEIWKNIYSQELSCGQDFGENNKWVTCCPGYKPYKNYYSEKTQPVCFDGKEIDFESTFDEILIGENVFSAELVKKFADSLKINPFGHAHEYIEVSLIKFLLN